MTQSGPDMLRRQVRGVKGSPRPEQAPRRTRRQTAEMLAAVPLFDGFAKKHLSRLAADTDELVFNAGESVVREHDPGETLFVVLQGEGKVVRGGKKVGSVVPGDFFGELSALDGGERSASIVALTEMRVLRLFRRTLTALIEDEPSVRLKLLDGIVKRVREVDRAKH